MDSKYEDRILAKIDSLDAKVDRVAETQATQGAVLDEHMRRTAAAEAALEVLRAEVKPLTQHVAVVVGLTKVVLFAGAAVGLVEGILHLVGAH